MSSSMKTEDGNTTAAHVAYAYHIDKERCKGCGLCVSICPKKVLEISTKVNAKGYFPVYQAHPEDCNFCAMCCVMCPDVAITISEIEEDTTPQKESSRIYNAA